MYILCNIWHCDTGNQVNQTTLVAAARTMAEEARNHWQEKTSTNQPTSQPASIKSSTEVNTVVLMMMMAVVLIFIINQEFFVFLTTF